VDKSPIHIDEFGTVRFVVYTEHGSSFEFEQEPDSHLLFITARDGFGRAQIKKIIDTDLKDNTEIVETYKNYLKERTDDSEEKSSDDR